MHVLMYGSETMIWKEKERSGIRRMAKVPNPQIRELYGVMKRMTEGALWWFGHSERMENDRIVKKTYVDKFAGSYSVG